jgi:DNA-binding response OmpR family regulator
MKSVVLIADSQDSLRETICVHLDSKGYKTLAVDNGADALKYSSMADLFVLELELNVVSGFNVIKQLRAWGNYTPVIVMSASPKLLKEAVGYDVVFSLSKPLDINELSFCVDTAIHAKQQLDHFHEVAHELMTAVDSWEETSKKFRELVPA